jgi:hypothetical protein
VHERKPKAVEWQPLDLDAVQDPTQISIGNSDTWLAQQAAIPIVSPHPQLGSNPLNNSSRPKLTAASLPDSANSNTQNSKKKPYKRHKRRINTNAKDKTMGTLPKSAYIPPHLRKRAIVATNTTGGEKETPATNGSNAASEKSKTGTLKEIHSSP